MRLGARAPACALAAALLLACAALAVPAAAQLPKLPAPLAKSAEPAAKPAESEGGPAEPGAKPAEPEPDAAPAASAPATPAELHAKLAEQRAALAREIEDVKARQSAAVGDEAIALGSERTLLETLDGGLSQLDLVVRMSESLAESEGKAPPPPALAGLGAAPYGLTDLDALQDALDADAEKRARRAAAAEVVKSELESANADLQRLEEARRLAREALGAAAPGAELAARRRLRVAELESRRGEVRRDIVARTLENAKREGALLDRDEGLLREGLARVRGDLELRPEELEAALADVDAREGKLERELERAKAELAERQSRLGRAQATLDATPPPAASLAAEVAARRTETRIGGLRTTLLEDQLGRTKAERELWRDRYRVLSDELGRGELRELDKKLLRVRDGLESARRIWETGREEVRSDAREARERATKAAAEQSETATWREREARSFEDGVAAIDDHLADLSRSRRLLDRALGDLAERLEVKGLSGLYESVAAGADEVWDRELTSVDDRPITVGKVVVALSLIVLGYLAASFLSRIIGRVVRRRSKAAEGGVKAIESLAFYALVTLFFLFSLDYVNIPLTAFTLLGGALAVGIGFGSQALMGNFISGLILLTERPIQVGDVIEIDGIQGSVDRIGPRSTRIRTFDDVHLIVPNSAFLEKNVVNWTTSSNVARATVQLAVAYGCDTRDVTKILRRAMDDHGQVLEDPEPIVLLQDFGESALVFRATFCVRMRDVTQRGRIASDVRYRIDKLFREAGIAMAYPQRDVHLDATRALDVRLVSGGEGAPEGSTPEAAARAAGQAAEVPTAAAAGRSPGTTRGEIEGDDVGP